MPVGGGGWGHSRLTVTASLSCVQGVWLNFGASVRPAISDGCRLCDIKISVGDSSGKSKYISDWKSTQDPWKGNQILLKIHLLFYYYYSVFNWIHKIEKLPLNKKQPPFALALTPILQDKKQKDDQNQNSPQNCSEIDAILAWAECVECHFLSL